AFDAAALDDLKRSIDAYGVLVPIIVRPRGDGYEIVAGERRWRASAQLQRRTIPAIVREAGDRDTLEVAMIENLQRENLNALEEAAGYQSLVEDHGFSQADVARRLGKSQPAVSNALRLLALPDAVKAMLADGSLSAGHGRALLAAGPETQLPLARRAVAEGLPVRAIERILSRTPRNAKGSARLENADDRTFESRLREHFGTHAAIVRAKRGGRIELRFSSEEQLVRLGDLLLGDE
ncbi:MAG TPA: ParB/RepB/Spo0J family partition protein, partial [Candidatus Tumulicola sp.]|nr:ParB/RepB/Spo0J family partition protein [Candidatus Tumulicola sp.]